MRRVLVLGLFVALTACEPEPTSPSASPDARLEASAGGVVDFCLTLLHNNDGESKLVPSASLPDFGGIARFATLVDSMRGPRSSRMGWSSPAPGSRSPPSTSWRMAGISTHTAARRSRSAGVTYQLALENFLRNGLGGQVTAAAYPDTPSPALARITRLP
jgi:hypothetical protein